MVHTSGQPESRKKGKHFKDIQPDTFTHGKYNERVQKPKNDTEKGFLTDLIRDAYDAEYKYQQGTITRWQRDEFIEEAEENYDERIEKHRRS